MPKPTFRDRFYTPQVARALTGPLGIVLAGVGIAGGIVVGLPIAAAVGIGALAYGARVAVAIPRGDNADGINPFELQDPWRTFVWQAKKSQRQFRDAVGHTHEGPLRERLTEISDRIDTGVQECWKVAQGGQALTEARSRIDIASITRDLSALPTGAPLEANPALADTAKALQAQLDTARRMDEIITTTRDRLRLLDARLGELVTRVLELSVRPQGLVDLTAIGADVDSVVGEMESLRQALDETDGTTVLPAPGPVASGEPLSSVPGSSPAAGSPTPATPASPAAVGPGDPTTAPPTMPAAPPAVTAPLPPAGAPGPPATPATWPPTPPAPGPGDAPPPAGAG